MIELKPGQKKHLIDRIEKINDKRIIDEIYRLLDIDFDDSVYVTNQEQREAITEARRQIDNNQIISEKDANKEMDEWLET